MVFSNIHKILVRKFISVWFGLGILFAFGCNSYTSVGIRDGVLLLPENWEENVISLKGEWELYWNVLDEWEKIDRKETEPLIVSVPGSWNSLNPAVEDKGFGYATYRLKVKNLIPGRAYYFKIKNQSTAYSFYWNRKLIAKSGTVGRKETESIPQYRVNYVSVTADQSEGEILFVISNFHHSRGGFRYPVELGVEQTIITNSLLKAGFELVVMGAIIAMGFFHLIIYSIRRNEKHYLYFSLFCFLNAIRLFVLDNFYITYFYRDLSWYFLVKMDYATTPLVAPIFLEYLRHLYPEDVSKKGSTLVLILSLGVALLVMVTPPLFFTSILVLNNSVVIFSIIFAFYATLKIHHYKRQDSRLLLIGILILAAFGIHDLLSGSRLIEEDLRLPIGLFIFFVIQALILSRRNSEMFLRSRKLSQEISEISESLEILNQKYSNFVPRQFIQILEKKTILDVNMGDHISKNLAFLSSDIRGFTGISEGMTPEENFTFLNSYLTKLSPIVSKNHGFVDRYIGDAILALFPNGSGPAIQAGIEMHRVIQEYNLQRKKKGYSPISIGVGIHQGQAQLGIIGEEERMQTSAISEAVHLTSIMEGLTKKYGAKILISVDALYASDYYDQFPFRIVDSIKVVPEADAIGIAEILLEGLDETSNLKIEYKDVFERGVYAFLSGDFQEASDLFEVIVSQIEADEAAKLYYNRSQKYLKYGAPPGWETSDRIAD
jgi:hypothetical protein